MRNIDAMSALPILSTQRTPEHFSARASAISRLLARRIAGFHLILAMALVGGSCLAAEPSLSFQTNGKAVPLARKDSQRLIQEIEALVRSANFDSRNNPGFFEASDFRTVDEIRADSFLHVHYSAPTKFATIGGDLMATDIWIDIRPNNPRHGGLYPGPTTLVSLEGVAWLGKESGVLLDALGLDPAIYAHLPEPMQKTLESGRKMVEEYRRSGGK